MTPGAHPEAGASWIKATNDPVTIETYFGSYVLGTDPIVTDCEQQSG